MAVLFVPCSSSPKTVAGIDVALYHNLITLDFVRRTVILLVFLSRFHILLTGSSLTAEAKQNLVEQGDARAMVEAEQSWGFVAPSCILNPRVTVVIGG